MKCEKDFLILFNCTPIDLLVHENDFFVATNLAKLFGWKERYLCTMISSTKSTSEVYLISIIKREFEK